VRKKTSFGSDQRGNRELKALASKLKEKVGRRKESDRSSGRRI